MLTPVKHPNPLCKQNVAGSIPVASTKSETQKPRDFTLEVLLLCYCDYEGRTVAPYCTVPSGTDSVRT